MHTARSAAFFVAVLLATLTAKSQYNVLNQTGYNRVGSEFWASGGAGIAERGVYAIALTNPSLLSFDAPTVTLEADWRPRTEYEHGIGYDNTWQTPSYAAIGFPLTTGSVEIGYAHTYDDRLDYGRIPITTAAQPDGTGEYFEWLMTSTVHTAFVAASINVSEDISVGIETGMDFVRFEYLSYYDQKGTGSRFHCRFGASTRLSKAVTVGLTGYISQDKSLDYTTDSPYINAIYSAFPGEHPMFTANTPLMSALGGSFAISPSVTLLASAEYQNWSSIGGGQGLRDVWQYHIGLRDSVSPVLTLRAGVFTLRSPDTYDLSLLDEYFIGAGATWELSSSIRVSITFLASDLFSKDVSFSKYGLGTTSLKQRMLSGSVSYSW